MTSFWRRAVAHLTFAIGFIGGMYLSFFFTMYFLDDMRGVAQGGLMHSLPKPLRILGHMYSMLLPFRYGLLTLFAWLDLTFRKRPREYPDGQWPRVGIVVPVYKERESIERSLEALDNFDYPGIYDVIVVIDGLDHELDGTPELIRIFCEERAHENKFHVFQKPNAGKASALNYGIAIARGLNVELVMSVDGDALPSRCGPRVMAPHFQDPKIAAVTGQCRVRNWLFGTGSGEHGKFPFWEGVQAMEYCGGNSGLKRAQSLFKIVNIIPGPSGMFRLELLEKIASVTPVDPRTGSETHPAHGPYPYGTLAEDMDITFTILRWCWLNGWGGGIVYEDRAVVRTDARNKLKDLFRQKYRWMRGAHTTLMNHLRVHFQGIDGAVRRRLFPGDAIAAWALGVAAALAILVLGVHRTIGPELMVAGLGAVACGLGVFHWLRTDPEPGALMLIWYFIFETLIWPQFVTGANFSFLYLALIDWHSSASFLVVWFWLLLCLEIDISLFAILGEGESVLLLPYALLSKPLYIILLDTFKYVGLIDILIGVPAVWHQRYVGTPGAAPPRKEKVAA